MNNKLLLSIAFVVSFLGLRAQSIEFPCHTHSMSEEEMVKSEEYRNNRAELERFTTEFIDNQSQNQKGAAMITKIIPVVIHIVHEYGAENIPDANVYDQIRILNEDFQKRNADTVVAAPAFAGIIGDVDLEFRLATKDPNGNCTNGITRIHDPSFTNSGQGTRPVVWPRSQYLNVWVVKNIASGAGAYTFLPGVGASLDGIVCRYTQFSSLSPSNDDRTMTHEIGHWFNLYHPWGTTNNPGLPSNCNDDDGVTDTPNTIGAQGCNLNQTTCGSLDNVQNYMDYAFCGMMFTNGQVNRMNAAINSGVGQRNNLWTFANNIATGTDNLTYSNIPTCAPIAEFSASERSTCAGSPIIFRDRSFNAAFDSSWTFNWSFPGAIPSTSTDRNPVVTYNLPGNYSATLTVTNSTGTSAPVTKNNYISILLGSGSYVGPYLEGIDLVEFPSNNSDQTLNWEVVKPSGTNIGWARTTGAYYSPPASVFLDNFSYNGNEIHELNAPIADLSNMSQDSAFLNFQIAYSKKSNEVELLYLYTSVNCGRTYKLEKFWLGNNLTSVPTTNSSFFAPTDSSEWRFISYDISSYAGLPNVIFSFRWDAAQGNNVFLDDIAISTTNQPEPYIVANSNPIEDEISIYPNPSSGKLNVDFYNIGDHATEIMIFDILGKSKMVSNYSDLQKGWNSIQINTVKESLKPGIYFIKVKSGNRTAEKKIIIEY